MLSGSYCTTRTGGELVLLKSKNQGYRWELDLWQGLREAGHQGKAASWELERQKRQPLLEAEGTGEMAWLLPSSCPLSGSAYQ